MATWQLFAPLGAVLAAGAYLVIGQRSFNLGSAILVLAGISLAIASFAAESPWRELALCFIGFFLVALLWVINERSNPIVAELVLLGPEISKYVGRSGFGIRVELRNGDGYLSTISGWQVTIEGPEDGRRMTCHAAQAHENLQNVLHNVLVPSDKAKGFLIVPFGEVYPMGCALKGVTFTVSIVPSRGRILPKSYTVVDSVHA